MILYIYKLIKKDALNNDMVYIGSTTNPKQRWRDHKNYCNSPTHKSYNRKNYIYIRENGGINEWQMVILDEIDIPFKHCKKRDNYENKFIKSFDATKKLNNNFSKRTLKEYYYDNKDEILRKNRLYKQNNKEKIKIARVLRKNQK